MIGYENKNLNKESNSTLEQYKDPNDWESLIVDHLVNEFKKEEGIDLENDSMAMERNNDAAKKA